MLPERLFQCAVSGHDLLIATPGIGSDRSQFESIQCALARQRLPLIPAGAILTSGIRLPHQHGQQRIVTQIVVIVEVFISQTQSVHALSNQFFDRVLDQFRITMIDEAPHKPGDDPRSRLDLPEQQASGIGSDRPSVKSSDHLPPPQHSKHERLDWQLTRINQTLCRQGTASVRV